MIGSWSTVSWNCGGCFQRISKICQEREQFGKAIIQYPAVYEMLTMMKVKVDSIRSLLYETARYVDMYKAYTFIQHDRKLEAGT